MRLLRKLVTGGGVAAFFFFSWIIQLLWNSIVVGYLGLLKPLTYLQAAGLWFLLILLFAWVGIGASGRLVSWTHTRRDWSDLGEKIESKVRKGLSHWADAEPDTDWDELGKKIEEKIKRKIQKWAED
jgi:hypothetical protein